MQEAERERREEIERVWFRRIMAVLMIAAMVSGAAPIVMNTLYPVQRNR
jgi:hypothetical protein